MTPRKLKRRGVRGEHKGNVAEIKVRGTRIVKRTTMKRRKRAMRMMMKKYVRTTMKKK